MERARKTIKQTAGDVLLMDPVSTEPAPAAKTRRKSVVAKTVATKKGDEIKMVEPADPHAAEAAEATAASAEADVAPKPAARRGRPAKSTSAAAPKAVTAVAAPKTSSRAPKATSSARSKPAIAKAPKAPASKAATPKSATPKTVKTAAPKVAASKPPTAKAKAPAAKIAAPKPTAKAAGKAPPKTAMAKPAAPKGIAPLEAGAEIKLGFLAESVVFHLRLAQDASYRAFARYRDKDLVKPGRLPALAIIHLNPGISQSALGRAIARDKSTVSPLIKDLQKNGFISRKASTADRRSVTLALTKKGERTLERLQAHSQEHESEVDKIIGTAKGRLLSMLDKITTGMAP